MITSDRFNSILNHIAPLRSELIQHPIYANIQSAESLKIFMQHHVFAVWDFMSLLKKLQRDLTCIDVPWLPSPNALAVRLVNEIVLAEESDDDGNGSFASHFELYRRSMVGCGADTSAIDSLLRCLRDSGDFSTAIFNVSPPDFVTQFVFNTFDVIQGHDNCAIASTFTFGREDLLPDVFERIVDRLNAESSGEFEGFIYYLNRHIELDGDSHGPMAKQLMESLCGDDAEKWNIAEQAALAALKSRKLLWDGMHDAILKNCEAKNRHTAKVQLFCN